MKDYRIVNLTIDSLTKGMQLFKNIKELSFPGVLLDSAYCYKFPKIFKEHCRAQHLIEEEKEQLVEFSGKQYVPRNGWNVYEFKAEFARQGVDKTCSVFDTVTCWNTKDTLCASYPQRVYIPHSIKANKYLVVKCSNFRCKNRFPALTFYYKAKKSSLWRAAQIAQGLMNNSCDEDEQFLQAIGETNPEGSEIFIFDARTQINAYANRATGGGLEKESNYLNCKVMFGHIHGINTVNTSYKTLKKTCMDFSKLVSSKFTAKIDSSGWYHLVRKQIK
mmetsp:Transcript_36578/g.42104  ORF Transcript_36578/g.42104 Transcript_36578/m.42104 type:complete len:276 (+) Transcript_36578:144-971(+)